MKTIYYFPLKESRVNKNESVRWTGRMDGRYQQQCLINIIILVPTALMAIVIMDTETSGRQLWHD